MPQLAHDLLQGFYDNSDAQGKLYKKLQKSEASGLLIFRNVGGPGGSGGLGKTMLWPLTSEALAIDPIQGKVSIIAADIKKLWALVNQLRTPEYKSEFKEIICLAFIVRQPVTAQTIRYQEEAYRVLLDYYKTKTEYKDLLLESTSKKVSTHIEELFDKFKKRKRELAEEEEEAKSSHSEWHQQHENHFGFSTTIRHEDESETTLSHMSMHHASLGLQQELAEIKEDQVDSRNGATDPFNQATEAVNSFLGYFIFLSNSTPDGPKLSFSENKRLLKLLFTINVYKLPLLQLRILNLLMTQIQNNNPDVDRQAHLAYAEQLFNIARTETNFFLKYFQTYGNTKTWQAMGENAQKALLNKLTDQEYPKKYPNYKPTFDFSRVDFNDALKVSLPTDLYTSYIKLFKPTYGRYTSSSTTLDLFKNRFTSSTRSMLR
jgi:hypothetical protein